MTQHNTTLHRHAPRARHARASAGIAMILVLVVLLVTTVLVAAALTSRENSPAIGANAAASAEANWSAESAANFAVGVIARTDDLSEVLAGNTLTQSMILDDALVEITITNLAGEPPAPGERELIVRASAEVGSIRKSASKRVTRIPNIPVEDAVDPHLDEFTAFATERLRIQSGAGVGVWSLSPEAAANTVAKIGLGFASASDLDIDPAVPLADASLFTDADASPALRAETDAGGAAGSLHIPLDVPAFASGLPAGFASLPNIGADILLDGLNSKINTQGAYGRLQLGANASLIIDAGTAPMLRFQSVRITNGSTLVVRGRARLFIEEDLDVDNGAIILDDDDASLTIYVGRNLELDSNTKVGIRAEDKATPPLVISSYIDPRRVTIHALHPSAGGSPAPQWIIRNQAAAVAVLHAPHARIEISGGALLCGRVAAREFRLDPGCWLLACPTIDPRVGFTETDGPLYDAGQPITGLDETLTSVLASAPVTSQDFESAFFLAWNAYTGDPDSGDPAGSTTRTQTLHEETQLPEF